jgi:hypothetical protein
MYGILNNSGNNSGSDSEILAAFVAPISVISNQPISSSDTLSLKRITATPSGHRWEIETGLMPSNDTAELLVHSVKHGKHTPFFVRFPQVYLIGKTYAKTTGVSLLGEHTQSNGAVVTVDKPVGNRFAVGEFIQFGQINPSTAPASATSKTYLITEISGSTISIVPRLNTTYPSGTEVIGGDRVTALMYYDTDTIVGMKYIDGVLMDMGTVKLVEAL